MNDTYLAMKQALARMQEAHEALALSVNPETLRLFNEAVAEARVAFEAHVTAAAERAQRRAR